jgi:hypothetical protein
MLRAIAAAKKKNDKMDAAKIWFWATIVVVLALHVPFLFIVRWPDTKMPTIAYSLPLGIVDFLIISGVIRLSENIFSKQSLSDDDEQ